jgi:hypothetical protein
LGDIEDYGQELFKDLVHNQAELAVNVGIIGSIAHRWPAEVQGNWQDKIQSIIERTNQDIEEVLQFAQAFD